MTGKEYLEIMNENNWKRSKLVKILEQQVKIFEQNGMKDHAEETKWLIFDIAEREQRLCIDFMEVGE